MVKPATSGGSRRTVYAPRSHYRIGFTDLTMDNLWDPESEKYKVLCRMVHVTKATLHIGYYQMLISFVFSVFFAFNYMMAITGHLSPDHWINTYSARYISQLLLAISLQLILIVVMIHGVRTERRSLLLPYIVYASITILAGCAQLGADFVQLDVPSERGSGRTYGNSQLLSHLIGTLLHAWCLSVVWRCYAYLGDKKVARQISEQLSNTQAAFHYPEQLFGCVVPQPPPYVDTVMRGSVPPPAFSEVAPIIEPTAEYCQGKKQTGETQVV
jgi:hypothetical protein